MVEAVVVMIKDTMTLCSILSVSGDHTIGHREIYWCKI